MAEKTIEYKILIDDAQSAKTLAELEESAESLNQELKNLDPRSDDFQKLAKAAQGVTDEIEEINNAIEGLSFEDKIAAFDGGMKILAGSTQSVVGAFGLLGIESEQLAFLEEQAANAIAFGLGLKDLSEGLGQVAVAFKKSGVAAKLFSNVTKTALIATGIGAFVVALGLVVANWDKVTKAVKNAADSFPFVGKAIEGIKSAFNSLFDAARPVLEFLGILPDEAERAAIASEKAISKNVSNLQRQIAVATAEGKSAKELFDLKKQLIEEEIKLLEGQADAEEELFKKRTELLVLEAAERKRLSDEYVGQVERETAVTVNAIQTRGIVQLQGAELTAQTSGLIGEVERRRAEEQGQINAQYIQNIEKLDAARNASLDNLIAIAGAETNVGRALLIAKQVLAARELILEAKKTISFASSKAAEATVATATGAAKTAAIGFPANIPLLIAYAVQAAGIIAAVVSAVRGAKRAGKAAGGAIEVPQTPRIPTRGASAPTTPTPGVGQIDVAEAAFQQQGTIKAYVVEGDVRTSQEAAAKIQSRRTLAG